MVCKGCEGLNSMRFRLMISIDFLLTKGFVGLIFEIVSDSEISSELFTASSASFASFASFSSIAVSVLFSFE